MGRLVTSVKIENVSDANKVIRCDALVDTGASFMILPVAWKDRLGKLEQIRTVHAEMATQQVIEGKICGPVKIQMERFDPIFSEVMFVEMQPEDGIYEPLLGYLILEQSQAAVDMVGHRLMHVKHIDLK